MGAWHKSNYSFFVTKSVCLALLSLVTNNYPHLDILTSILWSQNNNCLNALARIHNFHFRLWRFLSSILNKNSDSISAKLFYRNFFNLCTTLIHNILKLNIGTSLINFNFKFWQIDLAKIHKKFWIEFNFLAKNNYLFTQR